MWWNTVGRSQARRERQPRPRPERGRVILAVSRCVPRSSTGGLWNQIFDRLVRSCVCAPAACSSPAMSTADEPAPSTPTSLPA